MGRYLVCLDHREQRQGARACRKDVVSSHLDITSTLGGDVGEDGALLILAVREVYDVGEQLCTGLGVDGQHPISYHDVLHGLEQGEDEMR